MLEKAAQQSTDWAAIIGLIFRQINNRIFFLPQIILEKFNFHGVSL